MKYYEVEFKVAADDEILGDVKDVLAAMTAEVGLEAFEETKLGIKGYVQKELFDVEALDNTVKALPFDSVCLLSYEVREVEDKDWNEAWENEGFDPIVIDDKCVIHDGRHLPAEPADVMIEIDAKLAFGTGNHATTRMVISTLAGMDVEGKRVLDCGCGTGILSIAALKFGASEAIGYDIDEWSVDNAMHNAVINNVSDRFRSIKGDASVVDTIYGDFDIVLANINRNVLLADMDKFVAKMRCGGRLVLSGFYKDDIPMLVSKAAELSLNLACTQNDGDWACLVFS